MYARRLPLVKLFLVLALVATPLHAQQAQQKTAVTDGYVHTRNE